MHDTRALSAVGAVTGLIISTCLFALILAVPAAVMGLHGRLDDQCRRAPCLSVHPAEKTLAFAIAPSTPDPTVTAGMMFSSTD